MEKSKNKENNEKSEGRMKYPKDDEIVICTVSRIFPTTIFCSLDNYGSEGVIPISEISPGRIRNVRDFVKEQKKVACRVLNVDEEKGHITLSLRRVSSRERKDLFDKDEKGKNADRILEILTKKEKIKIDDSKISGVKEKHGSLFEYFNALAKNESSTSELGLSKKDSESLLEIVRERIKIKKVKVSAKLEIKSFHADGIERIKNALNIKDKSVSIKYLGTPYYVVEVVGDNYKKIDNKLKETLVKIQQDFKNIGSLKIVK